MKKYNLLELDYKQASSTNLDEVCMCCPWCIEKVGKVDVSYKLNLNMRTGVFHCFRCNASGRIDLKGAFLLSDNKYKNDNDLYSKLRDRVSIIDNNTNIIDNVKDININLEKISYKLDKKETPFALKYIKERGITDKEIKKFNIRVGKSYIENDKTISKWRGRILFPFEEDNKITYVIGRSYTGKEPKYLNSNTPKFGVVYNIDSVNGTCILTEGLISAIAAERYTNIPAVSLLGKTAVNKVIKYKDIKINFSLQLEKIRNKADTIYISLDGDVDIKREKSSLNIIKKSLELGFKVYLVELPIGKDPDDLKENYLYYFNKSKRIKFYEEF